MDDTKIFNSVGNEIYPWRVSVKFYKMTGNAKAESIINNLDWKVVSPYWRLAFIRGHREITKKDWDFIQRKI